VNHAKGLAARVFFNTLLGVFDLDSPNLSRFDEEDRLGCEVLAQTLVSASDPF
jgi:putative methionine-R-sulfoxide reductase with GAF domain